MGARPAWCTLSLSLPDADAAWIDGFLDGFLALAAQHDVALVGGDTTRGPLSICVTAHGLVERGRALRRDGARVGDDDLGHRHARRCARRRWRNCSAGRRRRSGAARAPRPADAARRRSALALAASPMPASTSPTACWPTSATSRARAASASRSTIDALPASAALADGFDAEIRRSSASRWRGRLRVVLLRAARRRCRGLLPSQPRSRRRSRASDAWWRATACRRSMRRVKPGRLRASVTTISRRVHSARHAGGNTLPGLRMPSGSNTALDRAHRRERRAASNARGMKSRLARPMPCSPDKRAAERRSRVEHAAAMRRAHARAARRRRDRNSMLTCMLPLPAWPKVTIGMSNCARQRAASPSIELRECATPAPPRPR